MSAQDCCHYRTLPKLGLIAAEYTVNCAEINPNQETMTVRVSVAPAVLNADMSEILMGVNNF